MTVGFSSALVGLKAASKPDGSSVLPAASYSSFSKSLEYHFV